MWLREADLVEAYKKAGVDFWKHLELHDGVVGSVGKSVVNKIGSGANASTPKSNKGRGRG